MPPSPALQSERFDLVGWPTAGIYQSDIHGPDKDCGELGSWQEVNGYYQEAGGPTRDLYRLDADRD